MYVNDNGKKPGGLLGEITTEFLGAVITPPLAASAFRVLSRRLAEKAAAKAPAPAPKQSPFDILRAQIEADRARRAAQIPSINVVTQPPPVVAPSGWTPPHTGGTRTDPYTYYGTDPGPAGTQGGGGGSSFGPPVEVGILPVGDSTGGGGGFSLAGLSANSPLLLIAAVAAFFLLGDNKPKRRRR